MMIDQLSPLTLPAAGKMAAPAASVSSAGLSRAGATSLGAPTDFGSVLGSLITDAAGVLRTAEFNAINGISGQSSVQEVVESVMAAEQTLQAAIAIRDKVTAAYLELSRMAI